MDPSFLDVISAPSITVSLADRQITCRRASLLRFFQLERLEGLDSIVEYVQLAAGGQISSDELESLPLDELLHAYWRLRELNQLRFPFPFMGTPQGRPDRLDYPGRNLVAIIHLIASAYGWSRQVILDLGVEEALFYVLEILAKEHESHQFQYSLSQVGFDQQGRKVPYPPLPWGWQKKEVKRGTSRKITLQQAQEMGIVPYGVTDPGENLRRATR